jgi:hypothetical protein
MTFTSRFASKKLLVGSVAALALSLSTGAFASVSAQGMGPGRGVNPPVVASQCDHPGYGHFGFTSKQDCLNYVAHHTPGRGQGGSGYGGGQDSHNVFVTIGNVVNSAVTVTINFVTNIFS